MDCARCAPAERSRLSPPSVASRRPSPARGRAAPRAGIARWIALLLAAATTGCAGAPEGVLPSPGPPTGEPGTLVHLLADWDDIEAAVDLAVSRSQCGYLEWHSDKPGGGSPLPDPANPDRRRWYTLLTIRDAQVLLDIRRDLDGPPARDAPEPITIRCRVGPSGDAAYERLILGHLSSRLVELRGDRTVPIPDPWGVNQ